MNLVDEVLSARKQIKTDNYSMSVNELIAQYQNGEIDIRPEFQRYYRWTHKQKTWLIESILLNIPIPPLFVVQLQNGKWEVIDGVQRLSTILEFVGVLKTAEDKPYHQEYGYLSLEKTRYLPSLEGLYWQQWNDSIPEEAVMPEELRLYIRRGRLDVTIVLAESDPASKYELFQRLNMGGTQLTDQEMRTALLVMVNNDFMAWLRKLAQDNNFQETVALTDRALSEQYDLELALRFVIMRRISESEIKNVKDVRDFIGEQALSLATQKDFDYKKEEEAFRYTFELLNRSVGEGVFRKYDPSSKKFSRGFLVSAFEAIALGIGFNFEQYLDKKPTDHEIEEKVKNLWTQKEFTEYMGMGVNASIRLPKVIPFGRKFFAP